MSSPMLVLYRGVTIAKWVRLEVLASFGPAHQDGANGGAEHAAQFGRCGGAPFVQVIDHGVDVLRGQAELLGDRQQGIDFGWLGGPECAEQMTVAFFRRGGPAAFHNRASGATPQAPQKRVCQSCLSCSMKRSVSAAPLPQAR